MDGTGQSHLPLFVIAPLRHYEERLRRGNPGLRAEALAHVTLDCRAEAGSQ